MVVKQGTLGEYYLTQGEITSAERVFASALDFVRRRDEMLFSSEWNGEEAEMSEEIALFNWATLQERKRLSNVEEYFLAALCKTTTMHMATTSKILLTLMRLLNSKEDVDKLKQIAAAHRFDLNTATGKKAVTASKRVAFVIDYSASMSGPKIRSAIENVKNIFQTHISDVDFITVLTFNSTVITQLPITLKGESEEKISMKISSLKFPSGETALYSAIFRCVNVLTHNGPTKNDWIIALTDGDDNCSTESSDQLTSQLQTSDVGLVMIGVGADVKEDLLKQFADAVPNNRGLFVFADGSKSSIDMAFKQAALLINANMIFEDV